MYTGPSATDPTASASHPPTSHPIPASYSPSVASSPVGTDRLQSPSFDLLQADRVDSESNQPSPSSKVQQQGRQGVTGEGGGIARGMEWTDVLLLASSICEHLGPMLVSVCECMCVSVCVCEMEWTDVLLLASSICEHLGLMLVRCCVCCACVSVGVLCW